MKILRVKDVAAELQVSQATVYRFINSGELRHINVGSDKRPRLRITAEDFEAWQKTRASRPAKKSA